MDGLTGGEPIVWRKPIRCGPDNGCVELAGDGSQIAVRDSTDRYGSPVLMFGRRVFAAFLNTQKAAS